ncbi:MAG: hypothetical protein GX452_10825 [Ignavibacteriales bacterium]|jgi:hypothetical protein|nr:hypothetical protein [Ignavibacteriaceae bacterium]NLH61885.1 hypothetical protein [Ignavibacteriales bacterium]HOJ17912.1 hypothetical protein [Ignavibacteriaceae bacterium]HPO54981.1 hypothetical protein [Ignavibacteriaceae bacterium]
MKKLFRNYNLDLDKNERKLLLTFAKQVIKQIQGNQQYFPVEKAFSTIADKLSSGDDQIKLTKDEYTKLKLQLTENNNQMKKQIKSSWFIKRWLYRSMTRQYSSLIDKHFQD